MIMVCRPGGIPARNFRGERLLLYIGIIDILQSYRLAKKLEHAMKSILYDGVSHSVIRLCTWLESVAFSALTRLAGRQEEHPACKNCVMRCWCGYLSGARCILFPADATASQNPIVSGLI